MMRFTYLTLILTMLAACGTRSLEVTSAPAQVNITQAADPTPVQMMPITWRLVTSENLQEFITTMRDQQQTEQFVFVALSMRDYENLTLNLAELQRYLEQQQAVIVFYRGVTAPRN